MIEHTHTPDSEKRWDNSNHCQRKPSNWSNRKKSYNLSNREKRKPKIVPSQKEKRKQFNWSKTSWHCQATALVLLNALGYLGFKVMSLAVNLNKTTYTYFVKKNICTYFVNKQYTCFVIIQLFRYEYFVSFVFVPKHQVQKHIVICHWISYAFIFHWLGLTYNYIDLHLPLTCN